MAKKSDDGNSVNFEKGLGKLATIVGIQIPNRLDDNRIDKD